MNKTYTRSSLCLLLFLFVFCTHSATAQNSEYRPYMDSAKRAYNTGNYTEAYAHLLMAEASMGGKWMSEISYWQIKAMNKSCTYDDANNVVFQTLKQEIKAFRRYANSVKIDEVNEQLKDIEVIQERLNLAEDNYFGFNTPEFTAAKKVYDAGNYKAAEPLMKKAADAGSCAAMDYLGVMYYNGEGVDRNNTTSMNWYKKAADKKFPGSCNHLGYMYYYGTGTEVNYDKAAEILIVAADDEIMESEALLGYMYEKGQGVELDKNKAEEYYKRAARKGHANAMNNLGTLYMSDEEIKHDYATAMKLFEVAAEKGDSDAMYNIAYMYQEGLGVEKNDRQVKKWLKKHEDAKAKE